MLVRGAEHAAQERGYSLLLADMDREAERTPASLDALIVGKVDGLIITSYIAGDIDLAARLRSRGTPAVVVTAGIPPALNAPALGIDNESGVRRIVDHLTRLGTNGSRSSSTRGPASTPGRAWSRSGTRCASATCTFPMPTSWTST